MVSPAIETLADLLEGLGQVPLDRIRFHPAPGTATERDVIEIEARENRLCELIDGVLVEKAMGFVESILAGAILAALREFVVPRNLGHVTGADGMMRLAPGLVRIPDVAFLSWNRFANRQLPDSALPELAPDLAVEVLREGNTEEEIERKRREYFEAGVSLVWIVNPRTRTASVFTSVAECHELSENELLDASPVLPGFRMSLRELFSELDRRGEPS
jgi:Uma2 family endonuclease